MRWIVGGRAVERGGASTSQMGRFETELLATDENLAALAVLSGIRIDRVHGPQAAEARRVPANQVLQKNIAHLLKRPVGRPPNGLQETTRSLLLEHGATLSHVY